MSSIAIIIPVLNEAAGIRAQLETLQAVRTEGVTLTVVDGGSDDNTRELADPLVDRLVVCPRGRAVQMNKGAQLCAGDVLLFLHADANRQRGEFVLLVSGAPPVDESTEGERVLKLLLDDGLSPSQATRLAHAISGVGRKRLYQLAQRLKGHDASP